MNYQTRSLRWQTEEFKRDAVSQVTDRGYSVKEVSVRLGISTKSLYDWIKQFKKPESVRLKESDEARENRRLKTELARVTEERDIKKRLSTHFARIVKWSTRKSKPQVTVFNSTHVPPAKSSS